jgi:hypothetical protein
MLSYPLEQIGQITGSINAPAGKRQFVTTPVFSNPFGSKAAVPSCTPVRAPI